MAGHLKQQIPAIAGAAEPHIEPLVFFVKHLYRIATQSQSPRPVLALGLLVLGCIKQRGRIRRPHNGPHTLCGVL